MRSKGENRTGKPLAGLAAAGRTAAVLFFLLLLLLPGRVSQAEIVVLQSGNPQTSPQAPRNPKLVINAGAPTTPTPRLRLIISADHMEAGNSSDQMRITADGGVDSGWLPYATGHKITLKNPGRNLVTVTLKNDVSNAAAGTYITWQTAQPPAQATAAPEPAAGTGTAPAEPAASPPQTAEGKTTGQAAAPASTLQADNQGPPQPGLPPLPEYKPAPPPAESTGWFHTSGSGVRAGSSSTGWLGKGGVEISAGPEYIADLWALRTGLSAQLLTHSARQGIRADLAYIHSTEMKEMTRYSFSLGTKLFSSSQLLFSWTMLDRYYRVNFPAIDDQQGGYMEQMTYALEYRYSFGNPQWGPTPSIFLRGLHHSVDSVKLGTFQVVLPDANLYIMETALGGGTQTDLLTGFSFGNQALKFEMAGGVLQREFEEILGHPEYSEIRPELTGKLELKKILGGRLKLWGSWDTENYIYGSEFALPIWGALELYLGGEHWGREDMQEDGRYSLGLRLGLGPIARQKAAGQNPDAQKLRPSTEDLAWLEPVEGSQRDGVEVLRPVYRTTLVGPAPPDPTRRPQWRAIPDQNTIKNQDYSLAVFQYVDDRGSRVSAFSVENLAPGLVLDTVQGIISGQTTAGGAYKVAVRALNAFGWSEPGVFNLIVTDKSPQGGGGGGGGGGGIPDQTATVGLAFILDASQYFTNDDPDAPTLGYEANGLPDGITINTTSGMISGVPTLEGDYTVRVRARNKYGWSDYLTFNLTVNPGEETPTPTPEGTTTPTPTPTPTP